MYLFGTVGVCNFLLGLFLRHVHECVCTCVFVGADPAMLHEEEKCRVCCWQWNCLVSSLTSISLRAGVCMRIWMLSYVCWIHKSVLSIISTQRVWFAPPTVLYDQHEMEYSTKYTWTCRLNHFFYITVHTRGLCTPSPYFSSEIVARFKGGLMGLWYDNTSPRPDSNRGCCSL